MPEIGRIMFPLALTAGTQAKALKIITALKRAYQASLVKFGELMEQWAINNVPVDLGTLISDFVSTVRSSPAIGAFVLGNPNTAYASFVDDMTNVYWTRWGRNPSKDHYFKRAILFAARLIPLAIHRAIVQEGIPARIAQPAVQIMNTYFQFTHP